MQFELQVARLRRALDLLGPVIPKNPKVESLNSVRLGGGMAVAYDLDTTVQVAMPEISDVEGECLLPYAAAHSLLRFTRASANVALVPREGKIHVYVDGTEASFVSRDPEMYPVPPELGPDAIGALVDGDDLLGTMGAVAEYASTKTVKPTLTAVCLTLQEPMEAAGADGFRLAWRTLRSGFSTGEGRRVLVARETVRLLQRLWKLAPPPPDAPEGSEIAQIVSSRRPLWMECDEANSRMQFRFGEVTVLATLVKGDFPNYQQLVPTSHTGRVTIHSGELERAVRQVVAVAAEGQGLIRLNWKDEKLIVKGQAVDVGEVKVTLEAEVETPSHITFDQAYLLPYLKGKDGPVTISVTTPQAPGVLTYQRTKVVIMPMLVSEDQPAAAPEEEPPVDETATKGEAKPEDTEVAAAPEASAVATKEPPKRKRTRKKKQG